MTLQLVNGFRYMAAGERVALCSNGADELQIMDISEPDDPVIVATVHSPGIQFHMDDESTSVRIDGFVKDTSSTEIYTRTTIWLE